MVIKTSVYGLGNKKLILKLFKDGAEYGILCVQTDRLGNTESSFKISDITPNKRFASEIFTRIVKYKAFSCSICEIIEDMLC